MPEVKKKSCKDCLSTTRKLPHPGPRCVTCHRARKKILRASSHSLRMLKEYNLAPGEYDALYEAQGGMCYTCGPWTGNRGLSKRLSVDHDHSCCLTTPTCGKCTRGLICGPCNSLLGQLGDSRGHLFDRLEKLKDYAENPPAQELLRKIREQTNS
jgi:Recombination endonuclease VII